MGGMELTADLPCLRAPRPLLVSFIDPAGAVGPHGILELAPSNTNSCTVEQLRSATAGVGSTGISHRMLRK